MANTIETDSAPEKETYRVIYRTDTGAIVAIETFWSEEVASACQPEALYQRLNSIMQGFTARTGSLDVLTVRTMPIGAMRVDLATRSLMHVHQGLPEEVAEPVDLCRPGVA